VRKKKYRFSFLFLSLPLISSFIIFSLCLDFHGQDVKFVRLIINVYEVNVSTSFKEVNVRTSFKEVNVCTSYIHEL
jgi:hypothetical protein